MLVLAWAPACYDGVNSPDEAGDGTGDTGMGDGDGDGDGTGDGDAQELPAPSPRFYRLTHAQWENTVQDLFGLAEPTGLSELLRDDPQTAGYIFDNDPTSLSVDEALWTGYRIAAGEVAKLIAADPALLALYLPAEGPSEAERIDAFVREFGGKAYRRPLAQAEVDELTAVFLAAPSLYTDVADPFVAGMRHVFEAVLQSPFFLYRIERSEAVVDGVIPLDDYELASRLSYFLWNTMPDQELFAAAEAGQLDGAAAVAAQTQRMLQDPRAAEMVVSFHAQLFSADKYKGITPSPNFFPDAPADLGELARTEHELFIRDVIYGGGGGLAELLTSNEGFVNGALAGVYGVPGVVGDEWVQVEFDPTQRKGVFTQIGFLAANATSVDPDPIHRGVFLSTRMFCNPIAAPPDGVPPLPATEPDQTNRERVAAHTESTATCAQCHSTLINPYGFVFEGYDAIGGWRTTDNGKPVDATAEIPVDTELVAVNDAVELLDAMAGSERVHYCYARHWVAYANARNFNNGDHPLAERIGAGSLEQQQSMQELLVALTTSPFFLTRAAEELP